jgi:hypothetical protein
MISAPTPTAAISRHTQIDSASACIAMIKVAAAYQTNE